LRCRPEPPAGWHRNLPDGTGPDHLIELIMSPEHIHSALAHAKIHASATAGSGKEERKRKYQPFLAMLAFPA
jgi:hypothetical protein